MGKRLKKHLKSRVQDYMAQYPEVKHVDVEVKVSRNSVFQPWKRYLYVRAVRQDELECTAVVDAIKADRYFRQQTNNIIGMIASHRIFRYIQRDNDGWTKWLKNQYCTFEEKVEEIKRGSRNPNQPSLPYQSVLPGCAFDARRFD